FRTLHGPGEVLAQLTFVFNLIPTMQEGFVWASWTIGVVMLFYAVFPLVYRYVRGSADAAGLFFGCLLLWLLVQLSLDYSIMPEHWKKSILQWSCLKHFPILAVGVLLFHLFRQVLKAPLAEDARRAVGNALIWGGAFAFAALLQGWLPAIFGASYYWQGMAFAVLSLGLALSPWRWLVNAATRYAGKISYSICLWHPSVVFFLAPVYTAIYRHSPSLTISFLACLAFTFAVLLPLAALSYRLIEKPGMQMGKTVSDGFRTRHAPAMASRCACPVAATLPAGLHVRAASPLTLLQPIAHASDRT
ncbi:MAG: acyltransferase family protein, partial [Longimicrobiales bacterium]